MGVYVPRESKHPMGPVIPCKRVVRLTPTLIHGDPTTKTPQSPISSVGVQTVPILDGDPGGFTHPPRPPVERRGRPSTPLGIRRGFGTHSTRHRRLLSRQDHRRCKSSGSSSSSSTTRLSTSWCTFLNNPTLTTPFLPPVPTRISPVNLPKIFSSRLFGK